MTSAFTSLGRSSTPLDHLLHVRRGGEIALSNFEYRQLSAGSFTLQCGKRDTKSLRGILERQRDKPFGILTHTHTHTTLLLQAQPPHFKTELSRAPVSRNGGDVQPAINNTVL